MIASAFDSISCGFATHLGPAFGGAKVGYPPLALEVGVAHIVPPKAELGGVPGSIATKLKRSVQ